MLTNAHDGTSEGLLHNSRHLMVVDLQKPLQGRHSQGKRLPHVYPWLMKVAKRGGGAAEQEMVFGCGLENHVQYREGSSYDLSRELGSQTDDV